MTRPFGVKGGFNNKEFICPWESCKSVSWIHEALGSTAGIVRNPPGNAGLSPSVLESAQRMHLCNCVGVDDKPSKETVNGQAKRDINWNLAFKLSSKAAALRPFSPCTRQEHQSHSHHRYMIYSAHHCLRMMERTSVALRARLDSNPQLRYALIP